MKKYIEYSKEELTDMALHKEKSLNNDRIVIMSNAGQVIYKAEHYDDKQEKLYNLYIVIRDENKSLISIIKSQSAKWDNDHWSLYNPIEYREKDETIKIVQFNKNVQNMLKPFNSQRDDFCYVQMDLQICLRILILKTLLILLIH